MRSFIFVMLAGVLLTLAAGGACLSARAQGGGRPTRPLPLQRPGQSVMRVRGASGKGPVQNGGVPVPEKPRPLTPGEKLSLAGAEIAKLVANVPWTLTPAKPVQMSRGYLLFSNPLFVNADFNSPDAPSRASLISSTIALAHSVSPKIEPCR